MSENIYYNPEKFDLAIVVGVDFADSWEFKKVVVWRHERSGELFFGMDSGCSCPTPFEDFSGVKDLRPVPGSLNLLADAVREYFNYDFVPGEDGQRAEELLSQFLDNVRLASKPQRQDLHEVRKALNLD